MWAEIGQASGIFNIFRFLGAVPGMAIAAAAFFEAGNFDSALALNADLAAATCTCAGLSLLGVARGLLQPGAVLFKPVTPRLVPYALQDRSLFDLNKKGAS